MEIDAATEPLPSHAYLPGQNPRHPDGFLDHVKHAAPAETRNDNSSSNQAWMYGLRLIEHGFYWEAHEVLETVWLNAPQNSRERHLVQGVIHIANAALKQKMSKPSAAKRLYRLAATCLQEAFPGQRDSRLMGLHKNRLKSAIADENARDLRS